VHAHRVKMDADYSLASIEAEFEQQVGTQAIDKLSLGPPEATKQVLQPADDPIGWLYNLVMGSIDLDLPEDVSSFLSIHTARYLDPFLDGEVPASQYTARSRGLFATRIEQAWAAERPPTAPATLELPPECLLGAYVRHAITKMNTCLGFGVHMPGQGRQPTLPYEQDRHHKLIGTALAEALKRDFEPAQRCIGSREVDAEIIVEISSTHLKSCIMYQSSLADALAAANRDGEEARQQERMRIWGYS